MDVFGKLVAAIEGAAGADDVIDHVPAGSAEVYSAAIGTRLPQQAKAFLLRTKGPAGKEFAVLALPADKRADLAQAAPALGAREKRLAGLPRRHELADFRKLDYNRDACLVWWMSCKENRREKMTCREILDG
ncbi:MAG: YbaK/EbsC family protein [Thermoplasmatota archaeon]